MTHRSIRQTLGLVTSLPVPYTATTFGSYDQLSSTLPSVMTLSSQLEKQTEMACHASSTKIKKCYIFLKNFSASKRKKGEKIRWRKQRKEGSDKHDADIKEHM